MNFKTSFAAAAMAFAFAAPASATTVDFGANGGGDCTFGCVERYQQVYRAASFGASPVTIDRVSFFAYDSGTANSSFTMTLSTSTRSVAQGLLATFGANVGGDAAVFDTEVFGSYTANSMISFLGSFSYDPSAGDLLVDIVRTGGDWQPNLWASVDAGYQRAYAFGSSVTAEGLNQGNYGNRTQFGFGASQVPEPASLGLVAVALLGLGLSARRRAA